jgi:hypothetical protein
VVSKSSRTRCHTLPCVRIISIRIFQNGNSCKTEKAFAATGIFPFNPDVIILDESAPSYVTQSNPDIVHQLPKMPDSRTADANAAGREIMTNESGNVASLCIQSGNHDSSLLPPATGIKVSPSEMYQGEEESSTEVSDPFITL